MTARSEEPSVQIGILTHHQLLYVIQPNLGLRQVELAGHFQRTACIQILSML